MGAFEYVAMDQTGKRSKGLLEGDTPKHVRQILRDRHLYPVSVTEVAQKEARRQTGFHLRRGLSAGDLALITRQLASLSQSGLPLEEALLAVAQQNDQPRTKSILLGVRAKVIEGHTLADGLAEFPQAFPELYRATVAAGEQSGHLDVVLERLADYTESRQELRQRITNAMVYPIALVVMAVGIISFMLATVVPKIVGVFENTNAELPALTAGLIATSDFLRAYWPFLIVAAILLAQYSRRQRRADTGGIENFRRGRGERPDARGRHRGNRARSRRRGDQQIARRQQAVSADDDSPGFEWRSGRPARGNAGASGFRSGA
jgi:general secretion pathway protein F